ncbi:CLUMA_CG002074, isoform A [Clunio marinus]|uniref:CLUMA_CG002074, isoform A n=1 Tax=Clunio marinus TaxID=568069 RepID=A0A1J1HJS6_9DIPT|nr:CLUMA_CG002074, isoform A [Clunio marinus]
MHLGERLRSLKKLEMILKFQYPLSMETKGNLNFYLNKALDIKKSSLNITNFSNCLSTTNKHQSSSDLNYLAAQLLFKALNALCVLVTKCNPCFEED